MFSFNWLERKCGLHFKHILFPVAFFSLQSFPSLYVDCWKSFSIYLMKYIAPMQNAN